MTLKTYLVEFRRTSYVEVTVEAQDKEYAEELAWQELDNLAFLGLPKDAAWEIESLEEIATDASRANGPHYQGEAR